MRQVGYQYNDEIEEVDDYNEDEDEEDGDEDEEDEVGHLLLDAVLQLTETAPLLLPIWTLHCCLKCVYLRWAGDR